MRIALVSPLYESVPPKLYGGAERIVAYLTQELVQIGHEVILFASGYSRTNAHLIAPIDRAIRLDPSCRDGMAQHILMFEMVAKQARDFDIIHYHVDYLHFPLSRRLGLRHLTTLHGRLDLPEIEPIDREFYDMPLVSSLATKESPFLSSLGRYRPSRYPQGSPAILR